MKYLIVNGDDFGFTGGVNSGILRAFTDGIVTSTTVMANGEAFDDAVDLAKANPDLGVGCHLVAVGGRPVAPASELSGLLNREGCLPKSLGQLTVKLAAGSARIAHLEREFAAQVEKIIAAGISPTHFDTHKHAHVHPEVLKAVVRVACDFGIKRVRNPFGSSVGVWSSLPDGSKGVYLKQYAASAAVGPARASFERTVRSHGIKTPDFFYGVSATGLLNREVLMRLLEGVPDGITELVCHPGGYDAELESAATRLKQSRQRELDALTDRGVKALASEIGIRFINYREIA
jgi:hopanoid biosynthesis associated protein HpnK